MTSVPRLASLLRDFSELLHRVRHDALPDADDHALSIVTHVLEGRRSADGADLDAARLHFAKAAVRLAFLACPTGTITERLLDFDRRQLRRLTVGADASVGPWLDHTPTHHFDRALRHVVRVAYLLDPTTRNTDERSLPDEAADAANYLVLFLAVRARMVTSSPSAA